MSTEQPPRLPFNEEVFQRAQAFCRFLLNSVPELEGVAIVPTFKVPQEHLPHGVVMGQLGPLRTPDELMHMNMQLYGTLRLVMQNTLDCLQGYDQMMGKMAAEAARLNAEVAALQIARGANDASNS